MFKRDNGSKRTSAADTSASRHTRHHGLRSGAAGSLFDDAVPASPARFDAAMAAEDDYARFLHRGH
jgi:hypothetical protein